MASLPCPHSVIYAKPLLPDLRSIRVLDLQPSLAGPEGPIRGSLRVVSLDKNPSYEALSYVWGKTGISHHIICDGTELPLTKNCYDALLRLRRRNRSTTIWVDSICINQSDFEEKGKQVKLMRDIYWNAKKVYIWLGPGNKNSDDALDWLLSASLEKHPLLGRKFRNFPGNMMPSEALKLFRMLPELIKVAIHRLGFKNPKPGYKSEGIKDLVDRDWFKRMWTMQELVMAQAPVVICGEKSVRWNNMFWGFFIARDFADNRNNKSFSTMFNSIVAVESFWFDLYKRSEWNEAQLTRWSTEHFPALQPFVGFMQTYNRILKTSQGFVILLIILIRSYRGLRPLDSIWLAIVSICLALTMIFNSTKTPLEWQDGFRSGIVGVLNMIRTRQASEKVDKVFALYGILREFDIILQDPDYSKPVNQVYLEFTRTVINWHRSLDILVEACLPKLPNAPSWVPDWSRHHHRVCSGRFTAADDSPCDFKFSGCGQKLETRGKLVDKIEFCTTPLQEQSDDLFTGDIVFPEPASLSCFVRNVGALRQWVTYVLQLQHSGTPDSNLQDLFDVTHSEVDFRDDQEGLHRKKLDQVFKQWLTVLTADYSSYVPLCAPDLARALTLLPINEPLGRYHHERCWAIAGKRIFFKTSKGHIGTGPLSMQVGDTVALFSGLHVPMILRKSGLGYHVVGSAYIAGMMKGEKWAKVGADLQWLALI